MRVELVKEFRFEAAHRLPQVPEGHKCGRLHGHSYRIEVSVAGEADPKTGWLIDYGEIGERVDPLIRELDHHTLNEIRGLENSTSEVLSKWLYDRLKPSLPLLRSITVWETSGSRCVYAGE